MKMDNTSRAPKEWRHIKLGDIARITAGGDVDREASSLFQSDQHQYPVYANALENAGIHSYSSAAKHPAGAVTITARGSLGHAKFRSTPFTAIGRLLVIWPNKNFDGRFLAEYLNSRVHFAIESTGVPQLTAPQAGHYEILLPPKREQRAIAEALSDADGVIEGLERLIAKKRRIKQGAMQELLTGKRRLPGFSGEWRRVALGEVGRFVGGGTPSMAREDYWKNGTIPWVSSSDVRVGELHGAERLISTSAVKSSSTRVVDPGSILFVTRSGILRRFLPVMINTVPVAINQDIKALLPKTSAYIPAYVFHAAAAAGDAILRDCMKTGTTVESIDLAALRRFEIGCPSDQQEQIAISKALSEMEAEIRALETRLAKARAIKAGMMEALLTGRIRLAGPLSQERATEAAE
ncbi:restriction endonuclease subunit S [Ruegeria arenilitoris]|uniref:restriction endonuclease subunit S n=1 Tax=Ruegeria arenilitoris TaxID=1173585 RepID=UPI00147E0AF3|nr:restriction endonuclease subunit S [Ruegeria arenilitoris]